MKRVQAQTFVAYPPSKVSKFGWISPDGSIGDFREDPTRRVVSYSQFDYKKENPIVITPMINKNKVEKQPWLRNFFRQLFFLKPLNDLPKEKTLRLEAPVLTLKDKEAVKTVWEVRFQVEDRKGKSNYSLKRFLELSLKGDVNALIPYQFGKNRTEQYDETLKEAEKYSAYCQELACEKIGILSTTLLPIDMLSIMGYAIDNCPEKLLPVWGEVKSFVTSKTLELSDELRQDISTKLFQLFEAITAKKEADKLGLSGAFDSIEPQWGKLKLILTESIPNLVK